MLIAVMSDSHDNIPALLKALDICQKKKVAAIIHCGDFISPFMLKELDEVGIPVYGVLGNNDGSQFELARLSFSVLKHITLSEIIGTVDIGGTNIAFTHYREIAEGLACTGKYDYVCFGHSHQFFEKRQGKSLMLNPGELMGKNGTSSFCIINTKTDQIEKIDL